MPSVSIFLDEIHHESIPDKVRIRSIGHNAISVARALFCITT